jgi:hypothetical protein
MQWNYSPTTLSLITVKHGRNCMPNQAAWTFALLALAVTGNAAPTPAEQAELQAAIIVSTFDQLSASCDKQGGHSQAQHQQIQAWSQHHPVAAVRSRLPQLRANAEVARQFDQATSIILRIVTDKDADPCTAAVSFIQLPDAQFPQLALAPSSATTPIPPTATSTLTTATATTPTTPSATPTIAAIADDVLTSIDSFGFATRPKMGFGGFIALDIYPIVLFKNGEVLRDVEALQFSAGLSAHKAANPDEWSHWRRQGETLQWLNAGNWQELPFQNTYAQLPEALRFEGRFRSVDGVGSLAIGGNAAVTLIDEYQFSRDGSVVHSGALGSQAAFGDTSVVTSGGPAVRNGHYRVQGLLLHIDYDDGSREQRILITDPTDPSGAIWLDGKGYAQKR